MGTRAVPVNRVLDQLNVYAIDFGAPPLAVTNYYVVSHNQSRTAKTLAQTAPPGGYPRNVTVTATQAGGSDDTAATVTVTGTNVNGDVITEDIVPVNGSTVAGTKAFATITGIVQSAWVAGGTADTMVIGYGALLGLPAAVFSGNGKYASVAQLILGILGGAITVLTPSTFDADEPEKNTVASGTAFDGTKRFVVLFRRT